MLTNAENDDAQVKRLVEAVRALLYRFGTIAELEAAFQPFRHRTDEQLANPEETDPSRDPINWPENIR